MGDKSRIAPEQSFPGDLAPLEDSQVEILNSKVHRQLDLEYTEDQEPNPETESRYEELKAELDYRADEDLEPPTDIRDVRSPSTEELLVQQGPTTAPIDKTPA